MQKYIDIFQNAYADYWNYISSEVLHPSWHNYFYWLIGLSIAAWFLEIFLPWRKKLAIFRKDFWLDGFYMFFNFFLFSLIIYNGISEVFVELFADFLGVFGVTNLVALKISNWPVLTQFLLMFVLADFIQWNVHRSLHKYNWLWQFHKVHHSVKEMGFAAHLRFHWMETIIYKSVLYVPLAMIGFGIDDFFVIHIIAVAIGHLNHANVGWDYGPFKYIFNNPKMHIWHHAKELPESHPIGMNFGISLSIWDYLFKTSYVPHNGRDIELGFPGDDKFPEDLPHQLVYPLSENK